MKLRINVTRIITMKKKKCIIIKLKRIDDGEISIFVNTWGALE